MSGVGSFYPTTLTKSSTYFPVHFHAQLLPYCSHATTLTCTHLDVSLVDYNYPVKRTRNRFHQLTLQSTPILPENTSGKNRRPPPSRGLLLISTFGSVLSPRIARTQRFPQPEGGGTAAARLCTQHKHSRGKLANVVPLGANFSDLNEVVSRHFLS